MRARALIGFCLAIVACAPAGQVTDVEQRLAAVEQRLEALETQGVQDNQALWALRDEVTGPAHVDFSSQNFSIGHSEYGAYLIAPVDINEAGAGYRVRFRVVNATSVVLSAAEVRVSWIDGRPKAVTEIISGDFAPGTGRLVTITLAEATPATLRNMNVTVRFSGARFVTP